MEKGNLTEVEATLRRCYREGAVLVVTPHLVLWECPAGDRYGQFILGPFPLSPGRYTLARAAEAIPSFRLL